MNDVIEINEYIEKVITELNDLEEFYKVRIYGGEFNTDDSADVKRSMSKQGKSNGLVAFVEAIETPDDFPNRHDQTMNCIFVVYVLNMTDRGSNGYSSKAYEHGQKVLQLLKNNRFDFNIASSPKILSFRNISNEIKQNKEIAKMAIVWSQDMALANSDRI